MSYLNGNISLCYKYYINFNRRVKAIIIDTLKMPDKIIDVVLTRLLGASLIFGRLILGFLYIYNF